MAQTLGTKLTENAENIERGEQIIDNIYRTTHQVMAELGGNLASTPQTQQGIVLLNKKLQGANGNMKGEVQRNVGTLVQKYTEAAKQEDAKVEADLPTKPY